VAVSEQTPVNSSTGNGVTTVFPYTFKILNAADIEVTVDGVVKTITTHYTLSGVGADAGGDVTFLVAPADTTTVIRRRNMALVRTTDYQAQGELPADVLNDDQDAPVLMLQQVQEQVDRSLKAPLGESPQMILPSAANRANKTPVFDANGDLTVAATPESAQAALDAAVDARDLAQDWATKTDAPVVITPSNEYSAKEYAQGSQAGAGGSAKDWATKTDAAVSGGEFSAKYHAQAAADDADIAAAERAAAETARDAAAVNANVYADTTAGLAATASGSQFQVAGTDEIIRYLDNAGVAEEKARFPSAGQVRAISLVSGIKKFDSLVPLDAFADTAYLTTASLNIFTVKTLDTDVVYKRAGVKSELPGTWLNSLAVRPAATIASLDSKWATFGYVARDAGGVFHANALRAKTATNKTASAGVAFNVPAAANRGTIDLDSTHRLYYAQVQLAVGSDGKYLFFEEVTAAGATDYIGAPFLFVTAAQPALSELNIFPGERGTYGEDYIDATARSPLVDSIGASLMADHAYSLGGVATTATVTDAEVLEILPTGSVISLPFNAALAAIGNIDLAPVAGLQNKYVHASVFLYSETGVFTGTGVDFFLLNGATTVGPTSLDDTTRFTQISANLRRYDFVGQFLLAWATYGVRARALRTNNTGPAHALYAFGFMAAVDDARRLSEYIQPTGWVPKNEVARGFQMTAFQASEAGPWAGKKIVWMGTSIPHGGGYPEAVASALGAASIAKITLGGGRICAFPPAGTVEQSTSQYRFSLEAADISAWAGANIGAEVSAANYSVLQPGSGVTLTQAMLDALVQFNYENTLIPNYDGDVFVFDYGINDSANIAVQPDVVTAAYDRKYFNGALRYIWKKIYDYKAGLGENFAAVVITHHNRNLVTATSTENSVVDAQFEVSEYLGLPCANLADNLGLNATNLLDYTDGLHFVSGDDVYYRVVQYLRKFFEQLYP
jgi:hypothetical protein